MNLHNFGSTHGLCRNVLIACTNVGHAWSTPKHKCPNVDILMLLCYILIDSLEFNNFPFYA